MPVMLHELHEQRSVIGGRHHVEFGRAITTDVIRRRITLSHN